MYSIRTGRGQPLLLKQTICSEKPLRHRIVVACLATDADMSDDILDVESATVSDESSQLPNRSWFRTVDLPYPDRVTLTRYDDQ